MLIDTHCHLNDPAFAETLPGVLERARLADVLGFVVPAYDRASFGRTSEIAGQYPEVIYPAYGIHPWFIQHSVPYDDIAAYCGRKGTVAVGEIGLDFSPECPPPEIQVPVFTRQLDMAAERGLPVLIHCRKAYEPLYRSLLPYKGRICGVLHSYSGGKELLPRFLDIGFYIAFSGAVTRINARKYHQTATAVPLERLLIETDAPSIATASTVASEVEPCHAVEVASKIAELRGLSLAEVSEQTTKNAKRLFRLDSREANGDDDNA